VNMPAGSSSYVGLQVLPAGLTLGGTAVPQGSLLVENGQPSPDKVFALDPTTGATLATLTLPASLDTVSAAYDPSRGSLFLLSYNTSASQVVEVRPSDGTILNTFPVPFGVSRGGLALDPATGELWVASSQSSAAYLMRRSDGAVLGSAELGAAGV